MEEILSKWQRYYRNLSTEERQAYLEKKSKFRQDNPETRKAQLRKWKVNRNPEQRAKDNAAYRQCWANIRQQAIDMLGGKCVKCGYDANIYALQIDHIHGDGAKHRKEANYSSYGLYKSVAQNGAQGKYQLLCANCNVIKKHQNGEMPHAKAFGI